MEQIKELINAKKYREAKELAEGDLVEKGYIHTKIFGWITGPELHWLNAQLRAEGWSKTFEDLDGIPVKECLDKKGNMVTQPLQFILDFEKVREGLNATTNF